jgi:hypothetical protein
MATLSGTVIPFWNSDFLKVVVGARSTLTLINRPVGRVTHPCPRKLNIFGVHPHRIGALLAGLWPILTMNMTQALYLKLARTAGLVLILLLIAVVIKGLLQGAAADPLWLAGLTFPAAVVGSVAVLVRGR